MTECDVVMDEESGIARARLLRPPHNFIDAFLLGDLCQALEAIDDRARCVILSTEGKNFCAGRDFGKARKPGDTSEAVYAQAIRLARLQTPMVAVVQGAAVGAGMGMALLADFRLCSERAYFSANFVANGLHHGFGMTALLPRIVGWDRASDLLMTGRKVPADEALALGLVSLVVAERDLLAAAAVIAGRVANNPPQAVRAIRRTMRANMVAAFSEAIDNELLQQNALRARER